MKITLPPGTFATAGQKIKVTASGTINTPPLPDEPYRPWCCRSDGGWLDYVYHVWWRCRLCGTWWSHDVENEWWERSAKTVTRAFISFPINYVE